MTEILGVKTNGGKVFVVTDAAMTEVIRPALYGSKHPVTRLTQPKVSPLFHRHTQIKFNPFSTMTHFYIYSGYYWVILYSFGNSCGD